MCLRLLDKADLFILFICQSSLSRQDLTCRRCFWFVCYATLILSMIHPHPVLLIYHHKKFAVNYALFIFLLSFCY